ncbi:MAG TPA: NUMOD3 domain-containing DNA-binding protein, partial [Methylomirabilota bacterium]|nr:NUMOD3 domain-containing DNA-binding protein [Methylomirabilota bacterium]
MISIYQLKDPETFKIRYVGQTVRTLSTRLWSHINIEDTRYITNWIKYLKKKGLTPTIELITQVKTQNEADFLEILLITYYKSIGYPLTNLDGGGVGTHRIFSEYTKEKMAAAKRGKKQSPETIEKRASKIRGRPSPLKGRKHTLDSRAKMSASLKGKNNRS